MGQPSEHQLQLVRDKLAKNKAFFQRQTASSKRTWARIKTGTIFVSSLVTVILGFRATGWLNAPPEAVANLALLLSATVTALATADSTFDFQWTWVNYGQTLTKIYNLEDRLEYLAASGEMTQDQLDSIFQELQAVLSDINSNWTKRRLKETVEGATSDKT
jgi:hypothetical protein